MERSTKLCIVVFLCMLILTGNYISYLKTLIRIVTPNVTVVKSWKSVKSVKSVKYILIYQNTESDVKRINTILKGTVVFKIMVRFYFVLKYFISIADCPVSNCYMTLNEDFFGQNRTYLFDAVIIRRLWNDEVRYHVVTYCSHQTRKTPWTQTNAPPDQKGLIKIISTRYFIVI
jgi:hypothetical protein